LTFRSVTPVPGFRKLFRQPGDRILERDELPALGSLIGSSKRRRQDTTEGLAV
jgi:hypothetical protein